MSDRPVSPYFERLHYLGASPTAEGALAGLAGLAYDGTASFRAGARFAPDAIRRASEGNLETYEPVLDDDLDDYRYIDLGDLYIDAGMDAEAFVERARRGLDTLDASLPLLGLGGEHTVTLPLIEHALKREPDLALLTFDAHTDLRDTFSGTKYSHACVMRRVHELIGPERMAMVGIRSGLREEFELARQDELLFEASDAGVRSALGKLAGRPLYVSFDLDGFDPLECPGTGTPEAGGFFWRDFARWLPLLNQRRVIGADVVELLPDTDMSGRSTVLAARLVRSLLLLMLRQ